MFLYGPVMGWGGMLCFFGGIFALFASFAGYRRVSSILFGVSVVGFVMVMGGGIWNVLYVPEYLNQTATVAETCTWTNNTTTSILICQR